MKKAIAFALTLVLLLSLYATGFAAPLRASAQDAEAQINLIFQNFSACRQDDTNGVWFYTVTDLDHNGRLELLASAIQNNSLEPATMVWEMNADRSALQPCKRNTAGNEVFANILSDSAETYYDKDKDAWFYIIDDYYPVSGSEAYVLKNAVLLKDGTMDYGSLAYEYITSSGSSFMDTENKSLSAEEFNAIEDTVFQGSQKSGTYFEWFSAGYATQVSIFQDSYAVFTGDKAPSEDFAARRTYPKNFLTVTKNPTNENHIPGESAVFTAYATAYTKLQWGFVSPTGAEFTVDEFAINFPKSAISGSDSTSITIFNVSTDMSGWSAFCDFTDGNRTVRTNQAWLYVTSEKTAENVDEIFYTWFYDGAWVCPDCGNVCYGDYCPTCGFNLWEVWYEYYDDNAYIDMIEQYYVVDDSDDSDDIVVDIDEDTVSYYPSAQYDGGYEYDYDDDIQLMIDDDDDYFVKSWSQLEDDWDLYD